MIKHIASLPYKLITYLKYRRGRINGFFFRTKIVLDEDNSFESTYEVYSSSIYCKGSGNSINIHNKLMHSEIRIEGNNNALLLEEGGSVSHSNILIRANNAHITVGRRTDILSVCIVCQGERNYIEIGDDCLFSRDVDIWNSDTHTIYDSDGNVINYSAPIKIGNHVWIGKHVRILKNVTIGDNTVVGMNSVVSKNLPNNSIAVGAPATVTKSNITWSKDLHQLTIL